MNIVLCNQKGEILTVVSLSKGASIEVTEDSQLIEVENEELFKQLQYNSVKFLYDFKEEKFVYNKDLENIYSISI